MPPLPPIRLGVNVDHVATVRNARGGRHPDPVKAVEKQNAFARKNKEQAAPAKA